MTTLYANALKRDNCKECRSKCEHAGKDREFICKGGISCKVVYTPDRLEKAAADFTAAIKELASKSQNLNNLESYLSRHFPEWLEKYASTPEEMAAEMKEFANMII